MSRRTATALRVADVRESAARAAVAAAFSLRAAAAEEVAVARQRLAEAQPETGPAGVFGAAADRAGRLAACVSAAEQMQADAQSAIEIALHCWTGSRQKQRLFTGLAQREADELLHEQDRAAQRLADDLSSTRAVRAARR